MDLLQQAVNAEVIKALPRGFLRGFTEVARICGRVYRASQLRDRIIEGEAADSYLTDCIRACSDEARRRNRNGWSRYESLYYLRRLADAPFVGELATTPPYDRALTEVIFTIGVPFEKLPTQNFSDGMFPFGPSHARLIAERVGFSRALSQLHVAYRYCGKGAPLNVAHRLQGIDFPFPSALPSKALRDAARLYDERAAASDIGGGLGFPALQPAELSAHGTLFITARITDAPKLLPFPITKPVGNISAFFRPAALEISSFRTVVSEAILADPQLWDADVPALAALLALGLILFNQAGESQQANYLRNGYFIVEPNDLAAFWDEIRDEAAEEVGQSLGDVFGTAVGRVTDLVGALANMEPDAWPPKPGAVVFRAALDRVGLDMHAATHRFLRALQYPARQGEIANLRAGMFESAVQEMIDETAWRPDHTLRPLIGRHLKWADTYLGEIDAIAARNDTALLISCKSFIYGEEYDRGAFRAVRAVRRTIEEGVIRWSQLLGFLREHPVGPNYDFSAFRTIHGVLVSPRPYFVEDPLLNSLALEGLRLYSTFEELEQWLNDPHSRSESINPA